MPSFTARSLKTAACLGFLLLSVAYARADDDHRLALDAVRRGDALPLVEVLQRLGPTLGGDVIELEFEYEDGRYVYEFEILTPAGQVQEVTVDAKTAEILEREND